MSVSATLAYATKYSETGAVSLTLTVTAYGMSPKVFAIQALPKSADPMARPVRFSHVCSPMELTEFPEDEPGNNCYYRVDQVSLVFDDDALVDHVLDNMRTDIGKLVRALNGLETAEDTITGSFTFE